MLSLAACGDVEPVQIAETPLHTASLEFPLTETEDIAPLDDLKGPQALPTETATLVMPITPTTAPITTLVYTPVVSDIRLTNDLLWLRKGNEENIEYAYGEIWRWKANSPSAERLVGETEDSLIIVPGQILKFNYQNGIILVSLIADIDDTGEVTYQLGAVDIEKKSYQVIAEARQNLKFSRTPFHEIALSADGEWVAYAFGLLTDENREKPNDFYWYKDFEVHLNQIGLSQDSILIGVCDFWTNKGDCFLSLEWAPDSNKLAWHGNGGIWISEINKASELVVEDFINEEDETRNRKHYPSAWSSNGQVLLYQQNGWEWNAKGFLDLENKISAEIPRTYTTYGSPFTDVGLYKFGQILVLQSAFQIEVPANTIQITIYNPDSIGTELHFAEFTNRVLETNIEDYLFEPYVLQNGNFLSLIQRNHGEDGAFLEMPSILLIRFDLVSNEISILNEYDSGLGNQDYFPQRIYWQKDGSAILVKYRDTVLYLTADGSVSEAITKIVGEDACCFAWVDNE